MGRLHQPIVLIVEDEPLIRMITAEGLQDEGFQVLEADSADEAFRILSSRRDVGVVFTDVNMPGTLDGLGLANLVHERWPNLRILVTSGRQRIHTRDLPEHGRYVSKPYRAHDIAHMIGEMTA